MGQWPFSVSACSLPQKAGQSLSHLLKATMAVAIESLSHKHISGRCTSLATEPLTHTPISERRHTYLVWCHKEVHNVVVELLECFLDVLLEEILHLSSDDGVLVVHHVREVGGVVVLRQTSQLILQQREGPVM